MYRIGDTDKIVPPEIWLNILSYLPLKDVGVLARTNSFWNECCNSDLLWKDRCFTYSPKLKGKQADETISSWKEFYKEIAATLTWIYHLDLKRYEISDRKKIVKLKCMDECTILTNTPLLPNRSYDWDIQFTWVDERFERYVGVTTKKQAYMSENQWALQSRTPGAPNPKTGRCQCLVLFKSGDVLSLHFAQGVLRINVAGKATTFHVPMRADDPLYPYVTLYDVGDSATIVRYQSTAIKAKAGK